MITNTQMERIELATRKQYRGPPQDETFSSSSSSSFVPQPRRPSAYAHYKKLIHDFDNLEEDLEATRLAQEQLEAQLQTHSTQVEDHARRQRERDEQMWLRERERQLEAICVHQSAVTTLHHELAALGDEEIRLLAELDVLKERQQQANESETKRVADLVHTRASLLDKELAKGQMDIEFLTQIVTTAKRKKQEAGDANANVDTGGSESLHTIVGAIQQRRQDAFKEAGARFQERLYSFEQEKEQLQRQTDELQWKKQRALQILSENQQSVIQGFFTTPRLAIQDHANPPLPSLAYTDILHNMAHPSNGESVSKVIVQQNTHTKPTQSSSARRVLDHALADATRNLEIGPKRLEALQKTMHDRQQDALRLNLASVKVNSGTPRYTDSSYDGRWSVETYRPDQYAIVYFIRSLVFGWMEIAVETARRQPEKHLLEMEIQRHDVRRIAMEQQDERQRVVEMEAQVGLEMLQEVIQDIFQLIHEELLSSATRVRDVVLTEMNQIFFSSLVAPGPAQTVAVGKTAELPTAPSLRCALFGSAWNELKRQHSGKTTTSIGGGARPRLIMQPASYEAPRQAAHSAVTSLTTAVPAQAAAVSPTKKRFGFFSKTTTATSPTKQPPAVQLQPPVSSKLEVPTPQTPHLRASVVVMSTEVAASLRSLSTTGSIQQGQSESTTWVSQLTITTQQFPSLASCGLVTCVQLSTDGRLLAVGTIEDEIAVFAFTGGSSVTEEMPVAVRAIKSSSTTSTKGRITRLCFSGCGRRLLAYNQFKVATLWSLFPPQSTNASHSSDCFPADVQTIKPAPLHLISTLNPIELLDEPQVPAEILTQDAPVAAARLLAAPPVAITALSFFSSVNLIGEQSFVMCGASNGDIIKILAASKSQPLSHETPMHPTDLAASQNVPMFEPPRSRDTELRILAHRTDGNRAFFRQAHSHSVLFCSSITSLTTTTPAPSSTPRLVSVDQRGSVALWLFSREYFSGFGWFTPHTVSQLDLSAATTVPGAIPSTVGEILQIQLTPDRRRLVLMVYYAGSSLKPTATTTAPNSAPSRLRFVQLDLSSNELSGVVPVRLEVDLLGEIPPRFALLLIPNKSQSPRPRSRSASTSRKAARLPVLVLLMDNSLHVYSLSSGERCIPPISLQSPVVMSSSAKTTRVKKPTEPKTTLLFNSITAASSSIPGSAVAVVAVAGEQHRYIRLIQFHLPHSDR